MVAIRRFRKLLHLIQLKAQKGVVANADYGCALVQVCLLVGVSGDAEKHLMGEGNQYLLKREPVFSFKFNIFQSSS